MFEVVQKIAESADCCGPDQKTKLARGEDILADESHDMFVAQLAHIQALLAEIIDLEAPATNSLSSETHRATNDFVNATEGARAQNIKLRKTVVESLSLLSFEDRLVSKCVVRIGREGRQANLMGTVHSRRRPSLFLMPGLNLSLFELLLIPSPNAIGRGCFADGCPKVPHDWSLHSVAHSPTSGSTPSFYLGLK
jgi:hypothetical protein